MLYLNYASRLCVLTLLCFSITQANWLNNNVFSYQRYGAKIQGRQLEPSPDGPTATSVPAATGVPTSSTSTSVPPPKTSATTPTSQKSNPTSATESEIVRTTLPKSSSEPTSTTAKQTTTKAPSPITRTTTFEPSTTVELITSIVTVSGSIITSVSSSTEITTIPSEPTNSLSSNSSTGTDSKTRNTIIGVISGIGALVLLAGIIFVIRTVLIRRRNKNPNRGWSDFGTGVPVSENISGMGNTRPVNPFQSTLENYHNPARVNASSNF